MKARNDIPTPEMLMIEAVGAVERHAPIDLISYAAVIGQLRGKNYSFGKIAEWLSERLGRPVNKGGVFRVYQEWEAAGGDQASEEESDAHPATDQEQIDSIVGQLAIEIRNFADDRAENGSLPEGFARDAILLAARLINLEQADEKAAETADAKIAEGKTGTNT